MCAILYFFLIVCNKPHANPTIIYENIKGKHILAVVGIMEFPILSHMLLRRVSFYTVGFTNGTIGTTNGTIGTNVSTNGNIGTNGTIGCRETIRVLWLPMVPLVKFPMVPLGECRTHASHASVVVRA